MSTEGINVEEPLSCDSAPNSNPGSPKNRVKFLCSHGGKILPRPADGHLKYVGGETRVISVPRDIAFQELMKKLTYLIEGEMILKYQLVPEELDALVSVKSDEDLRHMFNECDRHGSAKFPRLRAFLFPASPVVMENQIGTMEPHALEQRYIDAINGIIRTTSAGMKQHPTNNITQNNSLVSSACSSPRSPDSYTERLVSVRSIGRAEGVRYQTDHVPQYYYYSGSRQRRGSGCCSKCKHYEECNSCSDRRIIDRRGSPAMSPLFLSPRHGASGMKAWDSIITGDN